MSQPTWLLARQWLISTGVSLDNKSMQYSTELIDFAESIRDGSMLCAVLHLMKPGCVQYITRINSSVNQEFLCKKNITSFIEACKNNFKMKEKDLFETNDLYHFINFPSVLRAMSVLSNKKEATDTHRWIPFSTKKSSDDKDVELYEALSEEISTRSLIENIEVPEENVYDEVEKNYSNYVYETLILGDRYSCPDVPDGQKEKMTFIMEEILEKEKNYVEHLKLIVEHYLPELKKHMTLEEEKIVFMNIKNIYGIHMNFGRELCACPPHSSTTPLSNGTSGERMDISAFTRYRNQFLIYSYYCTNLQRAEKRVDYLVKRKQGFRTAVEQLNNTLKRQFSLKDQLAVCFQHILRYKLHLGELKKATPETHEDWVDLQDAFDSMEDVAVYINEYKRDQEIITIMNHIQNSLKFPSDDISIDLRNYGRHVKDGEIKVCFEGKGTKDRDKRFAFLFEHALMICKKSGSVYDVREIFQFISHKLRDGQQNGRGRFSHCFVLQNTGISSYTNCTFYTKTEADKKSWMNNIHQCVEKVTLNSLNVTKDKHNFVLTTFPADSYATCEICNRLLIGLISQGYVCQQKPCGLRIHVACLQHSPPCRLTQRLSRAKTVDVPRHNRNISRGGARNRKFLAQRTQSVGAYNWVSGVSSRNEAAELLKGFQDGSFLIRENDNGELVLSIQFNEKSRHIKINEENGAVYLTKSARFRSLDHLISHYKSNSLVSYNPEIPTTLHDVVTESVD